MKFNLKNRAATGPGWGKHRLRAWFAPAIVLLASCSKGEVHKAPIAIKGLVTVDGKPLADATVALFPDTYRVGRISSGRTDKTGAFSLSTTVDHTTMVPGGEPGSYSAVVTKLAKVQPRGGGLKRDVPTRYADVHTSDLKVVISDEPDQTVKLELRSR